VDGATTFSEDLPRLLLDGGIDLEQHAWSELLFGVPGFWYQPFDAVVSSLGPYAFLHHYSRECANAALPIIRDVHAGAWTGYLLQEWLCEPLTRTGDVVIFPSQYARDLYSELFPSTAARATLLVAHPRFPGATFPAWKPRRKSRREVHVGILGRLSKDKNTDTAISSAPFLRNIFKKERVAFHVLGGAYDLTLDQIRDQWLADGGSLNDFFSWGTKLPTSMVDEFFATIDLLLFPSTSNAEALGRVVLEARHASVPVCLSDHAAARELAPPQSIVQVDHFSHPFSCANGVPTGSVSPEAFAEASAICLQNPECPTVVDALYHSIPFVKLLQNALQDAAKALKPGPSITRIEVDSPCALDNNTSMLQIEHLIEHLRTWTKAPARPIADAYFDELLARTSDKPRTRKFLDQVSCGEFNYADLSGFPFQLAQLCSFHPTARARYAKHPYLPGISS